MLSFHVCLFVAWTVFFWATRFFGFWFFPLFCPYLFVLAIFCFFLQFCICSLQSLPTIGSQLWWSLDFLACLCCIYIFFRGFALKLNMIDWFLGRVLDQAGHPVSFWVHINLPYRIVSYRIRLLNADSPTEMYASRDACCHLVSHVEYAPRAPLRLEKKTGQTDRQTDGRTDRYIIIIY